MTEKPAAPETKNATDTEKYPPEPGTEKWVEKHIDRLEEAIGSLAVLVARHATIPMVHYPELSAITEVYLERAQARGQEKDERLKAIEEERKGLLQ
jgi:hypothetical protein